MIGLKDENQKLGSLRGGGCAASSEKKKEYTDPAIRQTVQLPDDFSESLLSNTDIIVSKALVIYDQQNQTEVLISIQWFICMEEKFILISCNQQLATFFINTIQDSFNNLLQVCTKYLRAAGVICLYVLRILAQLSKVIFYFYMQNQKRFMKEEDRQNLISQLLELESQMEIEASNVWVTGIQFEIEIIKACLKNLPTDSKQGQELLITFFGSAVKSFATMSLDDALIDTLIQGAAFIIDKYQTHNLKQLYQIFYTLDLIKWSIIQQIQKGTIVADIIFQLQQTFQKYILNSKDWMVHYCWIRFTGDLIQYRPIVQQEHLLDINENPRQVWNKLIELKIINPLAFNKSQYAKVSIFKDLNPEQMQPIKQLFKGIDELKKLSIYLTSSKNTEMNIFHSYIYPKVQTNQQTNQQQVQLTKLRNFLFLDKSIEYIENLSNIISQQMPIFQTNLLILFEKLINLDAFKNNKDINMIEIEIEYLDDSTSTLINQSQSLLLVSQYIIQYKIFYLNKQKQLIQSLSLQNQSDQISSFLEKMKINSQKLHQSVTQSHSKIDDFTNQLLEIQTKLAQESQIIKKLKENYKYQLTEVEKSFLSKINVFNLNQTKSTNDILLPCKEYLQQMIKISSEIKTYQTTLYSESKNLKLEILTELNYSNLALKLQLEYLQTLTDMQFIDNQIKKIQIKLEPLLKLEPEMDSFQVQNSEFSYVQQVFVLISEVFQWQQIFWNKSYQQMVKCNSLNEGDQQNSSKYTLMKMKQEFLIILDSSLKDLSNNDAGQNSLIGNQKQESEQLIKDVQFFKQNLINAQKEDKNFSQSITNDIEIVLKILNAKSYIKAQLNTEYKTVLQNMQQFYSQYKEDQIASAQVIQQDNLDVLLQKVTDFINELRNTMFNFQSLSLVSNEVSQTIMDSQQAAFVMDKIGQQILVNLMALTQKKISDFLSQVQQFIIQIERVSETIEELNKQQLNLPNITTFSTDDFEIVQEQSFTEQAQLLFVKLQNSLEQDNQQSFLGQVFQDIKDKWNNQGYKLREVVAVSCIMISSNVQQEQQIQRYCQDTLIQIWASERDDRVKKILKNKEILEMQVKIFSNNLKGVNEKLKDEIQFKFQQIEKLEQEVKQEGDPQRREQLKQQLNQEFQQFEEYIDNMNDMNSQLRLSIEFLKTISKQIKRMEEKIDQLQTSINEVGLDVKFLRGKRYDQLLQIRRSQVLQKKNLIDQKSVYVNLQTIEKDVLTGQYKEESEFFVEDITNENAELNEFLWAKCDLNKEVLLIHGCAGSGKSTAARKIEEFLWLTGQSNQYIPIYVSLPTIKEPEQNIVEQALQQESYNFDAIQIKELKEAAQKKEFRLVLILDSYDEIKPKFIQKNLYKSNRLKEVWTNPKVIFTTRTEILTSNHYSLWFCGTDLSGLKEIEIQKFTFQQRDRYLEQFCRVAVKMSVIELYKLYLQIENKNQNDFQRFKEIWNPVDQYLDQIKSEEKSLYLTHQEILYIIDLLKKNYDLCHLSNEQFKNFEKVLENLWGKKKFNQTFRNIHIERLLETPFMMEIVVQVLPIMTKKYSIISNKKISLLLISQRLNNNRSKNKNQFKSINVKNR